MINRKGQAVIFIIVAILIVSALLILFVFRDNLFRTGDNIDPEFSPVYNLYLACIKDEVRIALDVLGIQGGRIDSGEYIPGSEYAPFSSHLNFVGNPIPYWYYIAGNNVIKENVPSKRDMEKEVSDYLKTRVNDCNFEDFYEQGFYIELDENAEVDVGIRDDVVDVDVSLDMIVSREDRSARKTNHKIEINSNIGKLYETAKLIYEKEIQEAYLEEYAVDVMRLYAPVDGVEIQCKPGIWKTREVAEDLKNGFESNMAAVKYRGGYYQVNEESDRYFIVDQEIEDGIAVNLLYSKEWPTKIEISPAGDEIMLVEPLGNQGPLGAMGFCYVPYHFVYDISFPVLIQVSEGLEIFQFPVAVVIDKNFPREAQFMSLNVDLEEKYDVCGFREGEIEIRTYDVNLNGVEAEIKYECFSNSCGLGNTESIGKDAVLIAEIPLCVNGILTAKADGYADARVVYSSNSNNFAEIILDREYETNIEILIGGRELREGEIAVVTFELSDSSETLIYPENRVFKFKEDLYDISVSVFGNSNVVIPSSRKRECFETIDDGLLGFFGKKGEECIDIEIPEVKIDEAVIGGGKTSEFILESDLLNGRLIIDVSELQRPNSLEQLQYNYEIFDTLGVQMRFI